MAHMNTMGMLMDLLERDRSIDRKSAADYWDYTSWQFATLASL
ncbi:MAG TPA: hypothetical protein VE089_00120 [Nitrososphaeraceae archaeon]|nr:hypothetical protein [Nitrososphaeraceae archaeon]